jgi:hypothetical protein
MPPNLLFEIIIKIIHRLDYTCYPKILHVNKDIREWILDNWVGILQARSLAWSESIPVDAMEKLNESFLQMFFNWRSIRSSSVAKAMLLKGAQVEYKSREYAYTPFAFCVSTDGRLDLAKIRNWCWLIPSSC